MKSYTEQLCKLEDQLLQFENENFIYKRAELAIVACQNCLSVLRLMVSERGFQNEEQECVFFKEIKAHAVSHLYFYMNLIELERHKPFVGAKNKKRYLMAHIAHLGQCFLEHREFYEYYLRGHSHRDSEFFLRKISFPDLHSTSIPIILDAKFSTSHDLILARIIANKNTIGYIRNQLYSKDKNKSRFRQNNALKWTGAKIDLIELVYALQSSGLVNNGQSKLNEVAEKMEILFDIDLGDIYRSFLEIRNRKTAPTKLLDILKTSLINKMIEADR